MVLQATIGTRGDPRTWSVEQPLTTAALSRLRSLGVTRLAMPESALKPLTLQQTLLCTFLAYWALKRHRPKYETKLNATYFKLR